MQIQKISAILLRGLLSQAGRIRPAWKSGVYVASSWFGGDYKYIRVVKP